MKTKTDPLAALPDPKVRAVLARLHAQADREGPKLVWRFLFQGPRLLLRRPLPWDRLGSRLDDAMICLDRSQGAFCYLLARALGARRVVEFGTSFGVSTIYLACAVRDNGGGVVIGTERVTRRRDEPGAIWPKPAWASSWRSARVTPGRRCATSSPCGPAAQRRLPALCAAHPRAREARAAPRAVIVSDNVGVFPADHADYVAYLRDPANGSARGGSP